MTSEISSEVTSIVALTPQQTQAIDLLVAGESVTETAGQVGVAYETVSRWRNHDPVFVAALNARRIYLWEANLERLRSLASKAIDVVEKALDSPQENTRLKAAGMVLRSVELDSTSRPVGDIDPQSIEKAWEQAALWRSLENMWLNDSQLGNNR